MKSPYHLYKTGKYRLRNGAECGPTEIVTLRTPWRYRQELMLLQEAIGVKPTGEFDPETRAAAQKIWERRNGQT